MYMGASFKGFFEGSDIVRMGSQWSALARGTEKPVGFGGARLHWIVLSAVLWSELADLLGSQ